MNRFLGIEKIIAKRPDVEHQNYRTKSGLESVPAPYYTFQSEKKKAKNKAETPAVIAPISHLHILHFDSNRELDLPDAPPEKTEIPFFPNMKKAEEDYNSIDYQLIVFNLWKTKARELF